MNIEEAKKYVKENATNGYFENQVVMPKEEILDLIDKLNPPKPVVPQYVVDWVDKSREYDYDFDEWFDCINQSHDVYEWLNCENKRQAELNALAFTTLIVNGRDAVIVEEDPRYNVENRFGVSVGYLLGLDTTENDSITDLIAKINEWAISHGLDKGNPKIEWMKVTEEVGEIRDVFLKTNDFDDPEMALKDAIGDSIVTLVVLCLQLGYDVEECLKIAYNNIKDRKGIMIDDNFVKTR